MKHLNNRKEMIYLKTNEGFFKRKSLEIEVLYNKLKDDINSNGFKIIKDIVKSNYFGISFSKDDLEFRIIVTLYSNHLKFEVHGNYSENGVMSSNTSVKEQEDFVSVENNDDLLRCSNMIFRNVPKITHHLNKSRILIKQKFDFKNNFPIEDIKDYFMDLIDEFEKVNIDELEDRAGYEISSDTVFNLKKDSENYINISESEKYFKANVEIHNISKRLDSVGLDLLFEPYSLINNGFFYLKVVPKSK